VNIALVTARAASKGLPGKNVRELRGKPLINWSIEAAIEATSIDRVYISTDCATIADIAADAGAQVPFLRPAELAGDDTAHIDVVRHFLDWLDQGEPVNLEYLVLLQPTSPLRSAADIDAALALAHSTGADAVVGVTPCGKHPSLTCWREADGSLTPVLNDLPPGARRQSLRTAYAINGAVYVNRPASLRQTGSFYPSGFMGYVMPESRSLDIDTHWDWYMVEQAMSFPVDHPTSETHP
jgi:CMP-N,N'-diacetyllegionaminic acid synthase